jgi:hypothetical protein
LTPTVEHIDLRRVVEGMAGPTIAFPLIAKPNPAAVVCESGNAMANVYLRGDDGWAGRPPVARCREVAEALVAIEGIDSVAIRGEDPDTAELVTTSGTGRVGWNEGGFWQEGDAFAESFRDLDHRTSLARTQLEEWPDAPFALTSLFASSRAGDLLVSAQVGWDLRTDREWPTHHASHGALHRHHTVVPLLSSRALDAGPRRTIDVFADTLAAAGLGLDAYPQSDAALIARNAWRPGVAGSEPC